jgi:HEAT repeat protein
VYRTYLTLILVICAVTSPNLAAQNVPSISRLFDQLCQPSSSDHAAGQIQQTASKDPAARQYIVERLPGMIDKPQVDKVWRNAVRLAGNLKASETIPSLQNAFSRGQLGRPAGTTLGSEMQLDDDIVAKALAEIGEQSIPAVKSLLGNEDPQARRRAVLILLNMNGAAARKVLEDQLQRETDPKIRRLIESSLRP